jgi:pimeloyl-ACP methyl ester carboxylesterase
MMHIESPIAARAEDGTAIAYRTRGTGPADLLFMHGWGGSGAYFDEMLKYLDLSGLRVTTVDLRGHGASDKPEGSYSLDRLAHDMLAVADAIGSGRFVVVGYSMSAKFAQYLTCIAQERVRGQVLVAGCPTGEIPLPAETVADWISRAGDRERLLELERWFITQPVEADVLERWADDAVKIPRTVLDESLSICLTTSFVDQLSDTPPPTLIVGGLHDPIMPPDTLRAVVAAIPGARLALLDSNHDIPVECPREVAGLLEAFMAGLGPD